VSPWSRDVLRAELRPQRVTLARMPCAWPQRSGERWESVLPVAEDPRQWAAALEALEAGLGALEHSRPARLRVCLSNQFVRYALLPWSDDLRSESEVMAFARHRMRETYGDPAAAWEIVLAAGWPGVPRVAAAIERALLEALVALGRRAQLRLEAVEPHFGVLADSQRRRLHGEAFWLAAWESGRIVLARTERGEWCSLASARDADAPIPTLLAMLARESFGLDEARLSKRIYVHGAAAQERSALADAGWEAVPLAQPDAQSAAVPA
jgi:hypothetical protein